MEKYKKSHIKAINLRCELQHGMENLNYLIDDIIYIYQIFNIISNMYFKSMVERQLIF